MNHKNLIGAFFDTKWAILPEAMERIYPVVNQWAVGVRVSKEEAREIAAARQKPVREVKGKVGVLPLYGVISQRMNMIQEISEGGTSTEMFGQAFDNMVADKSIGAIVIDIDSPGGSVFGVEELATKIYNARGQKPIYGIANSLAASAAIWIGASVDEGRFFASPSAELGSVGVFALHVDRSEFNSKIGVKPTYVAVPPKKVQGNPDAALEPEAHAEIMESVQSYYDSFADSMARFRSVSRSHVDREFGGGGMLRPAAAKSAGLIDGIKTMDELMGGLVSGGKSALNVDVERARRANRQRGIA